MVYGRRDEWRCAGIIPGGQFAMRTLIVQLQRLYATNWVSLVTVSVSAIMLVYTAYACVIIIHNIEYFSDLLVVVSDCARVCL